MSVDLHREVLSAIDGYFHDHKWSLKICPHCSAQYFTKKELSDCGSYTCLKGYPFLDIPAPKQPKSLHALDRDASSFFSALQYVQIPARRVFRKNERTLFASTSGQVFDDAIYHGKSVTSRDVFCIQPVIRLQFADQVGTLEGVATSFLNIATDRWNSTAQQHIEAVDAWLNFLSKQGFYASNLAIKRRYAENLWGDKTIHSEMLKFNYGGLELGVANYFLDIPLPNETSATMSDISFGLERIAWAINKTTSYFDAVGPLSQTIRGKVVFMDTIRTLTLMSASGVDPSPHDHGSKFRALAKKVNGLTEGSVLEVIEYYYAQWSRFIKLPRKLQVVHHIIRSELDRNANCTLQEITGFTGDTDVSQEEYLQELTNKHLSINQVCNLMKEKEKTIKKIFLGGGGGEKDSVDLDKRFVSLLDSAKTLIYIPVAMKEEKYPGCQQWFTSVFSSLGVTKIEMFTDLHQEIKLDQVAGVYIGGGDTMKLWQELRINGFGVTLRQLINQGVPVYGGSAGAIVLGKDIRSSTEGKDQATDIATLDVLSGYAVYCHLKTLADAQAAQKTLNLPMIALSERSGACIQGQELEAIGFESVWILEGDVPFEIKPGGKYTLKTGS